MCEAVMCDCWATGTTTAASDDSGISRNASKYKYKSNTGGDRGGQLVHHEDTASTSSVHPPFTALTVHSRGTARLSGVYLLLARPSCVSVPPACGSVEWGVHSVSSVAATRIG